jgi:hypothetical protein
LLQIVFPACQRTLRCLPRPLPRRGAGKSPYVDNQGFEPIYCSLPALSLPQYFTF